MPGSSDRLTAPGVQSERQQQAEQRILGLREPRSIGHIAKSHVRKEAIVAPVLARRGDHPGLVREILVGCNRRYLEHLSALDDFSAGVRALDRLTKPRRVDDKTVKGINFFAWR